MLADAALVVDDVGAQARIVGEQVLEHRADRRPSDKRRAASGCR
jgi:hypothetical protein